MSQSNLNIPGKNETKLIFVRGNSQTQNIETLNEKIDDPNSDDEYDDFGFGDTIYS